MGNVIMYVWCGENVFGLEVLEGLGYWAGSNGAVLKRR